MVERDVTPTLFDRALLGFGLISYLAGAAARLRYGIYDHSARHFAVVDAANMLEGTFRMVAGEQTRWDTIWPPGEMAFTSLVGRFDATLTAAGLIQVLLSLVVPWLAADVARLAAGRRAFWFALAAASLHAGYVHHVGFFLSECLFQVAVAFAIWFTALAIEDVRTLQGRSSVRTLKAACAGLAWGFAALFRPNALPVALALAAGLVLFAWWARRAAYLLAALGLLLGLVLGAGPSAVRCTVLKGGFCPVSSNFAMNVALGQAGARSGLAFAAPDGSDFSSWSPPALLNRGYEGVDTVPAGIFDTRGVLTWVFKRIQAEPLTALRNSVRNGTDIFRIWVWPGFFGPWEERWFTWASWAFAIVVLVPSGFGVLRVLRALVRYPNSDPHGFVALLGTLAVFGLAALSIGEGRYRYPFDLWWIALAARLFAAPQAALVLRGARRALYAISAVGVAAAAAVLLFVSFPKVAIGTFIAPDLELPTGQTIHRLATQLSDPLPPHAPWNVGTIILACEPECAELRVHYPAPQQASLLEMTVDHNDTYRVSFYRGRTQLAYVELPIHRGGVGMFNHRLVVPKAASGFDNLSITPLYGDSYYSVGHIRLF